MMVCAVCRAELIDDGFGYLHPENHSRVAPDGHLVVAINDPRE